MKRKQILTALTAATLIPICITSAAEAESDMKVKEDSTTVEEILVTTRKRQESIMDVPDSVTAFSTTTIENSGIDEVLDFVDMTPNLTLRETFRAGVTFISMRGITTGQQGYAPVTFVVDGVQVGSLDFINQGALSDIERIEVLKGPQGALYGAGAIAGAINIITKRPSNELEGGVKASYATGNDFKLSADVSGPLIEDKLLFRLNAYHRDSDGNQETTDGEGLNFEEQDTFRARLTYLGDGFTADLKASYSDIHAGAAMQELVTDPAFIDDFDNTNAPGPARGILGFEDRKFEEYSAKLEFELGGGATITTVTGLSKLDQDLFGSISWQKPPSLSFLGPVGGTNDPFNDGFQDLTDNFEVFTQDIRITSSSNNSLRWMVGASYMDREAYNKLNLGALFTGSIQDPNDMLVIPIQTDMKNDKSTGFYAQINYDISEQMELTIAGRYDENTFDTTQCTDLSCSAIIQVLDKNGILVDKLENTDSAFQPKIQLSYDWSDDLMTYITYAEGFRFGFYNTGNLTNDESTTNYELGFKASLAEGQVRLTGAIFHIDYSDQQITSITTEPPFRLSTNIPESDIDGFELEGVAKLSDSFTLTAGLGYIDATITGGGGRTPGTPKVTSNIALEYSTTISQNWDLYSRLDYRHQSDFIISDGTADYLVSSKDYLNYRISLKSLDYTIGLFANNLTDERQATDFGTVGFGYVRTFNTPRSVGVEASYQF